MSTEVREGEVPGWYLWAVMGTLLAATALAIAAEENRERSL